MKPFSDEVKFLALPKLSDIEYMLEDAPSDVKAHSAEILRQYQAAQWRIMLAQRKAAIIATRVCRPDEYREIKRKLEQRLRDARAQFEDECLNVFSESCTRGL